MEGSKINHEIHGSKTKKTPYTLVLEDNDKTSCGSAYCQFGTNQSVSLSLEEFKQKLIDELNLKK